MRHHLLPQHSRSDEAPFTTPTLKIQGDLSFYWQAISDDWNGTSGSGKDSGLREGLILPTANVDLGYRAARGFNVMLQWRPSSHHHNESYLKGGYATIESLDFIDEGFGESVMKNISAKVGVNDINFGENHFRRTTNGSTQQSNFTINQAVESNLQATFAEFYYRIPEISTMVMFGVTNGSVDPSSDSVTPANQETTYSSGKSARMDYYTKVAYDSQLNDDLRLRVSGSYYTQKGSRSGKTGAGASLFAGGDGTSGDIVRHVFGTGKTATGSSTANMFSAQRVGAADVMNLSTFVKYSNFEVFGMYETLDGSTDYPAATQLDLSMTHASLELAYRFFSDKMYVAWRTEQAKADHEKAGVFATRGYNMTVKQQQLAFGWYMYKGVLARVEYVDQKRENLRTPTVQSDKYNAGFNGVMVTAAVSF